MLWRAVSIVGLLLLVFAYLVNQSGRTRADSRRYLLANVLGAGLLTAYSAFIREWVFVGLEGFWCLASLWALRRPMRAHDALPGPPAPHPGATDASRGPAAPPREAHGTAGASQPRGAGGGGPHSVPHAPRSRAGEPQGR
jgi:hypothetical protein